MMNWPNCESSHHKLTHVIVSPHKGPKLIQLPPLETRPNSNGKSSAGVRSRGEISGVAIEKRRTMEDARCKDYQWNQNLAQRLF